MNYTSLDDAYKIHHTASGTYQGTIRYSAVCIYCSNNSSSPLMNDGGAFRRCNKCKKHFRANVLNEAIHNFSYATHHLQGTN